MRNLHKYKLSQLIDRFTQIHNDQQVNIMETERENTEPNVLQSTEYMDAVHDERLTQSTANKALNKRELHKIAQNQETIIMQDKDR